MNKLKVGLFFGGRSTEHEVSVISALQAYENLDKDKYEVIPVYVSKEGKFYYSPKLLDLKNYQNLNSLLSKSTEVTLARQNNTSGLLAGKLFPHLIPIDLAFPLFHGSFGEDGCIQGVFETYQIPHAGFNVLGSAVAMDKVISKYVFQSLGFKVAKFIVIKRADWISDPKKALKQIQDNLTFPVVVKPADIGSTIGINKAKNLDEASFNIEVAFTYADKVLIEQAFENCIEVNCAALGYEEVIPSVCEMPIRSGDTLSFEDKYLKGSKGTKGDKGAGMASLSRKIPAPISSRLAKKIQQATVVIFKALEGCGVARIDYFVDPKTQEFWVNEVNSPPGSLAYYLYQSLGIGYRKLLDQLIESGLKRFAEAQKTQYVFQSGLLSQMAKAGGSKA
ncbi:D-alanine--D-alanine ligase [Candidatus Daviesbacteria bacterium]|nr:D-alanine--D-alanine ligase [Candidatus Daviesbacteria bacterium]